MKYSICSADDIPLSLPSGGHTIQIKRHNYSGAPKNQKERVSEEYIAPLDMKARGILVVFSLFVAGVAALGVNPHLAESVSALVDQENIEAAEAQKHDREEILWFARAIYSESEFTTEQYYIAWAIRNRVESQLYPGTYKEVVLQPYQFSGLNEYDYWYDVNISRDYDIGDHVWESALEVAREVYGAPDGERLLPHDAMHFYSPVAIAAPKWALGHTPVETLYGRSGIRFAFYAGVK